MKRRALIWAIIFLVGFILYQKWNVLISVSAVLLYTALFSVLLAPVCAALERRGVRQSHAAAYAVVGLFLMLVVLVAAFFPYLTARVAYLFKRISPVAINLAQEWTAWTEHYLGTSVFLPKSGGVIGATLSNVAGKVIRAGMTAAAQIGRIGFSLILTYYVLCDRKNIGRHFLLVVPQTLRRDVLAMLYACKNAMMGYFASVLKTSVFVASMTFVGLIVLGVEDAVLLSLFMGILEVIPYIGPLLASIPILLSALTQGVDTALLVLGLLLLVQQIEGSFVTPYFTASSTSVHPLAAVLSVFVTGGLLGFWGILFAIPILVLAQSMMGGVRKLRNTMKNTIWIY